MDTQKTPEEVLAKVEADLNRIKTSMPSIYKKIQERAKLVGPKVYSYVRRACSGEPNLFWACENGHVVGTAFSYEDVAAWVAMSIVTHGPDCLAEFSTDLLPPPKAQ